jgi:aminotransferase
MPAEAVNGRTAAPGLSLGARAARVAQAEIRAMTIECEKIGGINLAQGVCDTEVPPAVRRGAHLAIEKGMNCYTRFDGLAELRTAITSKMKEYNNIEADPETEVVVSAGSTGALYCACLALLDPGDEVVVFEPYYGYHINTLLAVEAIPRFVTLQPPEWSFAKKELEGAITPNTKAILVNSPANPSGKVFTATELDWIARCSQDHNLFVFTDEIYEYFLYDGRTHLSLGSLSGMKERTITISGFSKTYSITGWRIGYCVADARWAEMIGYMNDLVYVCAPSPLQAGVAAGLSELSATFYSELRTQYKKKRDLLCDTLLDAGLAPSVPQGAYYVLADVSFLPGRTSKEKAMHLLEQTGVASVPGEAFFHDRSGDDLVRFCFAKRDIELEEACRRLKRIS